MLLGAYELIRSRGRSWLRSGALLLLAPLMPLVTPYGPVETVRYYHLLLVDPPFAGRVTEWQWAEPEAKTIAFYALFAIAAVMVWLGRRRLTGFDVAVLVLTFAGGLTAIRGIVWFALACMVFVPVAIGHKLESKKRGEPRRGLNSRSPPGSPSRCSPSQRSLFSARRVVVRGVLADAKQSRPSGRSSTDDDRVFAPDRFSDWMLFKIPELRGRMAYDVRFELYDETSTTDSRTTFSRTERTGSRSRTGTASSSSTRRDVAHRRTSSPSREHGRSTETTSSPDRARPARLTSGPSGGTRPRRRDRRPSPTPGRARAASRTLDARSGCVREDRRLRAHDPWIVEIDDDPRRPARGSGRSRCTAAPTGARPPCSRRSTARRSGRARPHRPAPRRAPLGVTISRPRAASRRPGAAHGPTTSATISRAHEHRRRRERTPRRRDPRDTQNRRSDRERNDRGDAVVARVRHRPEVREPVREQLRQRDRREPGREQEQPESGTPSQSEIRDVVCPDAARRAPRPDP